MYIKDTYKLSVYVVLFEFVWINVIELLNWGNIHHSSIRLIAGDCLLYRRVNKLQDLIILSVTVCWVRHWLSVTVSVTQCVTVTAEVWHRHSHVRLNISISDSYLTTNIATIIWAALPPLHFKELLLFTVCWWIAYSQTSVLWL